MIPLQCLLLETNTSYFYPVILLANVDHDEETFARHASEISKLSSVKLMFEILLATFIQTLPQGKLGLFVLQTLFKSERGTWHSPIIDMIKPLELYKGIEFDFL